MKQFTKVCLVIALCFTIIGILCCGIGVAAGVSTLDIKNAADKNGFSISGWLSRWADYHTTTTYSYSEGISSSTESDSWDENYDKSFTASEIENLDVYLKAGAVTFEKSDDADQIQVHVKSSSSDVKVEQSGDTLSIQDDTNIGMFHNDNLIITVELPDNMNLDDITIDAKAGEVDLSKVDFTANTVDLNVDAGHVIAGTMKIADSMNVTVGAGEAELKDITAGDVTLDAGMGQIDYTGSVTEDMEADCGVGEIDINLKGQEEDYDYEVSCGVGDVKIGSHSYSALGNDKKIDNNADNTITLDCGVGQIRVMFR